MPTTVSHTSLADNFMDRSWFYEGRASERPVENERSYHRLVRDYYAFLVAPGSNVVEIGCGLGDLLAAVKPVHGVGVDFSEKTIALARQRHPEFEFHVGNAAEWSISERFDYLVLADLINDLPDVQAVFEHLHGLAHPRSRVILNFLNNLWRPGLAVAEFLGAKAPSLLQNWLSASDVRNLLHLSGWEVVRTAQRILWPVKTPWLERFLNRYLAPLLPDLCLTIFMVARPRPNAALGSFRGIMHPHKEPAPPESRHYRCSVVIPARNEAGTIESAVRRVPEMGLGTEIIIVEGHSADNTWDEIQRVVREYPHRDVKVIRQRSKGKGGAVREGFAAATGDLLFILDADLSVAPEEMPKFYEVARLGTAEVINGVRLVYPLEHEAMRFLNMVANELFGVAFSWLLGQRIKDTLCGTKVLFRADYEAISRNRNYFGDFDPFGDFDLLFGAAKLNLRIIDLPVRYRARTYGETNIRRWRHGWLLLRMVLFAAGRLKFL